jgi:hypothetical protein
MNTALSFCLMLLETLPIGPPSDWPAQRSEEREVFAQKLGRLRSNFGVPKNAPPQYLFHWTLDVESASILFPEGRADRRYMVVQVPETGKRYLSSQTKNSKGIHLDWFVELVPLDVRVTKSRGTLEDMLRRDPYSLRLRGMAPKKAVASLRARQRFAGYKLSLGDVLCWFVKEDGSGVKWVKYETAHPNDAWPNMQRPYPITEEEKDYLEIAEGGMERSEEREVFTQKLGRLRSNFGVPKNPPPQFKYNYTLDIGITTFLFPEGRADRRLMIARVPESSRCYLSCQTKTARGIRMDWFVELVSTEGINFEGEGTLEDMLGRDPFGWRVKPPIPRKALSTLRARVGFAGYEQHLGDLICWFVTEDGSGVTWRNAFGTADSGKWPRLDRPYPITNEEKSRLFRKRA